MPGLISAITGTLNSAITAANATSSTQTPWTNPIVNSAFFPAPQLVYSLWDQLVTYQLLVIDTTGKTSGGVINGVVQGSGPGNSASTVSINPLGNGTLAFTPQNYSWSFDLPITPQQLSITDAYSINTSATLRGILEEHSGVRFKNINVQGTFGVWPGRPSITNPPGTPNPLQSVFGGTISAAQNVATQFTSILSTLATGAASSKPTTVRPGDTTGGPNGAGDPENGQGTGYYQTLLLSQFLEQYAEAKRNPDNAGWRLVFNIAKQNQAFIVTPVGFTWNENVNKPMEINYNLQLKAWRRIDLNETLKLETLQVTPLSPGALQTLLNTVQAAQNTAAAAYNLIGSVRSDVNNILNIIRQTGVFVKQLAGVALAVNDLPAQLTQDYKSTISNFISTINLSNLFGPAATDPGTIAAIAGIKGINSRHEGIGGQGPGPAVLQNPLSVTLFNANAAKAAAAEAVAAAAVATFSTTLSQAQIAAAQAAAKQSTILAKQQASVYQATVAGVNTATADSLDPSANVFTNALQNPLLFSQVPVSSLSLNSAQQTALQTELNNISAFTVADLKAMRQTILTLCTQLENNFGAGDTYYSTLFNQPESQITDRQMTLDDYSILLDFYALLQGYDVLTATTQLDDNQILSNMEYVNALAATSNIEFEIPNSKIQVPVPYGLTIEEIAQRYLGDAQRWLEIATLNDLREPYIDQNGFQYSLLSNASGRNVVVGNNDDLFVGQTIYLYSSTQTPAARSITEISPISQSSFLLTLDGLANLGNFTVADAAYLQAYLPGTINSQNVIWMPSNLQTPAYDQINIPSSVANVKLVGLSKVDWLLDQYGNIVVDNHGDIQLAAGITNIIQALAIKFGTVLGSSLLDPDFGLGVQPGKMVSDTSAVDIYNKISNMITADPRFSGVSGLQVTIQPPGVFINLGVQLAGIQGIFPVGFQLPTSQL